MISRNASPTPSAFNRFFLSPLTTLLLLSLVDYARRHVEWYTLSLAIPIGGLALCIFWSGLRANILSAVFITAYGLTFFEPARVSQTILVTWLVAIPCGLLKKQQVRDAVEAERNRHAAALVNAANGNLDKLKQIHEDTENLLRGWKVLSNETRFKGVEKIRGGLATVLTVWEGWHQLYREQEAVKWAELSRKLEASGGQ